MPLNMEIEKLKDKLGDQFEPLKTYVDALITAKESAERASNEGKTKFKKVADERDALRATQDKLFEKLGVDSADEIDSLPDSKGQADAAKQYEIKIKQLTKQLTDLQTANGELSGKLRDTSLSAQMEKVLSGHDWLDRDTATVLLKNGVVFENDEAFFKTSDGKLISLDEGAKAIAQTKQFLLKSQGTGGSGFTGAGSNGGESKQVTMTRSDFDKLSQFDRSEFAKKGGQVVES